MTASRTLALLALVGLVLPGCMMSRTRTNEQILQLDPSTIRVGQSTWTDVLDAMGPPALAQQGQNIGEYISERHLRYRVTDTRSLRLSIPPFGILPLMRWDDDQDYYQVLITFDEQGLVTGVYTEGIGSIWRLTQDEEDRYRRPYTSHGRQS